MLAGWSRSFTLYCDNRNVFKYEADYCADPNKEGRTTNIVEELLKKCQITI